MAERVVINTGPLIALARADALEIAAQLSIEFLCPPAVRRELDAGASIGRIEVRPTWLVEIPLLGRIHPAAAALDDGEAEVIQLALDQGVRQVCIDERAGRLVALGLGLEVVGTLGLLLRAKTNGIVPALRPLLERLAATGSWYDARLIARVLSAAGE
jgi:predicted nucleic acid-binding protein